MDSIKLELGFDTNVNESVVLSKVKEMKLELEQTKKELDRVKREFEEVKKQKEVAEKVATELNAELQEIKEKELKKEAEEVIKKAIELGQYNPKLFELKVNQYLKDKETVLKELELLPKIDSAQKTSNFNDEAIKVDETVKEMMYKIGLDPKNKEDVEIFKFEFSKK